MRLLFSLIFIVLTIDISAQETHRCKNEVKIRALIKSLSPGDSIISYRSLSNAEGIVAEANGYEILSFTATLYHLNEPVEFSVTGSKFSDDNRKLFSRLKPGDYVYISDIRAKVANGPSFCLKSAYYRVHE